MIQFQNHCYHVKNTVFCVKIGNYKTYYCGATLALRWFYVGIAPWKTLKRPQLIFKITPDYILEIDYKRLNIWTLRARKIARMIKVNPRESAILLM